MIEDELLQIKIALKKQSTELEKRAAIIIALEKELHEVMEKNKSLETMLYVAKEERKKFLEDNQNLESEVEKNKEKFGQLLFR